MCFTKQELAFLLELKVLDTNRNTPLQLPLCVLGSTGWYLLKDQNFGICKKLGIASLLFENKMLVVKPVNDLGFAAINSLFMNVDLQFK